MFVIILHGSLLQIVLAALIMAAFTLAMCHLQPYKEAYPGDHTGIMAVCTHVQLFVVFFLSLVLKAAAAGKTCNDQETKVTLAGLNNDALAGVLIATCASTVVMLGYFIVTDDIRHFKKRERERKQREHKEEQETGKAEESFECFVYEDPGKCLPDGEVVLRLDRSTLAVLALGESSSARVLKNWLASDIVSVSVEDGGEDMDLVVVQINEFEEPYQFESMQAQQFVQSWHRLHAMASKEVQVGEMANRTIMV